MLSRFLLIIGIYLLLQFLSEQILYSDDLIYDYLGNQLAQERITEMVQGIQKWKSISYALVPLYLLLKFFLVTVCLSVGCLLMGYENTVAKLFQSTINAEFIFIIPMIIKLFWFSLVEIDYNFEDLQYFFPMSALNLISLNETEAWLIYPLQLLNIFEIGYWMMLAYQMKNVTEKGFAENFGFVASTYGVGLFIWVTFVVFLSINVS